MASASGGWDDAHAHSIVQVAFRLLCIAGLLGLPRPQLREQFEHVVRPVGDVVTLDECIHALHALALFVARHVQRPVDGVVHLADAVGIDQHGVLQLHRCPGELRQHQHAALVHMRGDELLGHEVQTVAQRRDPADVGGAVVAQRLLERHGRGGQQDGCPGERAMMAVDAPDELFDVLLRPLVDPHAVGRGHSRDQQPDSAVQLGAARQQALEGQQHFARALGIVHPTDRHDGGLPGHFAADVRHPRQVVGLLHRAADEVGMGADGKGIDADRAPAHCDGDWRDRLGQRGARGLQFRLHRALDQALDSAQRLYQRGEVAGVARHVKAHQIAIEQRGQNLIAPGQDVEHIGRRKRRVVEKGDLHIRAHLPHEARHQPQVVVVHPDHRPRRGLGAGGLRKQAVDLAEHTPLAVLGGVERGKAVENGPQRLFRDDVIELADLLGGQRQPHDFIAAIAVVHRDAALELRSFSRRRLFPRHPAGAVDLTDETLEGRHDAVGAFVFFEDDLTVLDELLIRLSVIDDDQR